MTTKLSAKKIIFLFVLLPALVFGAGVVWLILVLLSQHDLEDWHSEWFPNGKQIVFSVPATNRKDKGIYVFNMEGKKITRGTHAKYGEGVPTVSPDNKKIVFSRGEKFVVNLWMMNADGSNERQLTSAPLFYRDVGAFFSPSGKHLAFVRRVPTFGLGMQADLMLFELETGKTVRLRQNTWECIWKNDKEIYLPSGNNVNILDIQTGTLRTMILPDTNEAGHIAGISFSTDQELLIQCPKRAYLYQLCIRKLFSTEKPQILTDEQFNVSNAQFNPNGDAVLFGTTEWKGGSPYSHTIYFLDIQTKDIEKLYTLSLKSIEVHNP